MGKMASLHAEGITNLQDYNLGKEHQLLETVALIQRIIETSPIEDVLAPKAFQALLSTLSRKVNTDE